MSILRFSSLFLQCSFFLIGLFLKCILSQQQQLLSLRIGLIADNVYEQIVFQEAYADITKIMPMDPRLNLTFETRIGCSGSQGLSNAAEMYFVSDIDAIIGPGCAEGMDCVAMLTAFWNMIQIIYTTSSGELADKTKFNTVVRVTPTNANTFTDVILTILKQSSWNKVSMIYDDSNTEVSLSANYLLQSFASTDVNIQTLMLSSNDTVFSNDILQQVDSVRRSTRVVIVMMGQSIRDSKNVMNMLKTQGITSDKFVIILPWLKRTPDETLPWLSSNSTLDTNLFNVFTGSFLLDGNRNITSTTLRFYNRLIQQGFTLKNEMKNFSHFSYLYDGLKLYLIGLQKTLAFNDISSVKNTSLVIEKMRGVTFEGASGNVEMDSNCDRKAFYVAYKVNEADNTSLAPLANIALEANKNCNASLKFNCYLLQIFTSNSQDWSDFMSLGKEPLCGFDGDKCNTSSWYIIAGVICVSIMFTLIVLYAWRKDKKKVISQLPWLVPIEQVEFLDLDKDTMSHQRSIGSCTNISTTIAIHDEPGSRSIVFNNTVKLSRFKQLTTVTFGEVESMLLSSMKNLVHDNINPFVGMCCNNQTNELLVLWKYCNRGTLSEYLHNSEMRIDTNFKTAFLRDIISGLEYLHSSPFGYHGNLCTSNCVIDANFIVKIVSVGVEDLLDEWKKTGVIADYTEDFKNNPGRGEKTREYSNVYVEVDDTLYRAPEFLRNTPPTRIRMLRMGKSEQHRFRIQGRMADVYSLAMVMYEVLFRRRPFSEVKLPKKAVISLLKNAGKEPIRPEFPKILNKEHHPAILSLIKACWSENPLNRPPVKKVKKMVSSVYKVTGGLVASVIAMMDQHAHSLEKQVKERTRLLEEAQMRADRLLTQMIPKDVARDLKLGKPVVPRMFTSASVLFTDIVSFTNICAESTPVEIVNFLNDLFTGYDDIIGQMDAFKVETIGDAYMVVSGVPKENGTEHACVISQIALKMRYYLLSYKLPHKPEHKMQARWGMHSGPVAAGVVGLTAPRYCLFGDTVNMSSRMESSGEPEKIQISGDLHDLLISRGDKFCTKKRGLINVKGKGEKITFWLIGEQEDVIEKPTEVDDLKGPE